MNYGMLSQTRSAREARADDSIPVMVIAWKELSEKPGRRPKDEWKESSKVIRHLARKRAASFGIERRGGE